MSENIRYWLMKTEPDTFSIDDLKKKGKAPWDGVRNYQARNYMRDQMKVGDLILFYHSSTEIPGVAGIAKVCKEAYPDFTFKENPNPWRMVDVEFVEKFKRLVPLTEIKAHPALQKMLVIKRGMRLSIQPVSKEDFETIRQLP